MQFNLIEEQWIPVKRKDGKPDMIAPWEVTDGFPDNPVVSLNAPRPDFNGALIQFLIGLVQTTATPASRIEWKQKLFNPPAPDYLKTKFAAVSDKFELTNSNRKFMQDYDGFESKSKPIGWILIGAPTEHTLEENRDHFIKRDTVDCMCPSCAATALFTMQTNSPMGGPGYRTSIRGGGPLTTLVFGDDRHDALWQTIWLNILEEKSFNCLCNSEKNGDADRFPWLAAYKPHVTSVEIHPAQLFWATPRRIRLDMNELKPGKCDVCAAQSGNLITSYREVNKGTEYLAPVKHHLSPYDNRKGKGVLVQTGGVGYRHWLGFILPDTNKSINPAIVVNEFVNNRFQGNGQFRLWAFGYDMESMKAQCWYESKMPLLNTNESIRNVFEDYLVGMIKAASVVAENLRIAIKNALHGRPNFDPITKTISWTYKDIKKLPSDEHKRRAKILYETSGKGLLMAAEAFFWHDTESHFYETLHQLKTVLESGGDGLDGRSTWHETICREARRIFGVQVGSAPIEDGDPKRIVIAQNEMEKSNKSKMIKELIGLS